MKKVILFILVLFSYMYGVAQYRYEKHPYRPAPKKGEIIAIVGVLITGCSVFIVKDATRNTLFYTGAVVATIGVSIDLGKNKSKKHKRNKRR